jgi:hypothetical protein
VIYGTLQKKMKQSFFAEWSIGRRTTGFNFSNASAMLGYNHGFLGCAHSFGWFLPPISVVEDISWP